MNPILVRIPLVNLPIQAYAGMLALSFLVGWLLVKAVGRRHGWDTGTLASAFLWAAASAMVGSRVLYVVANGSEFAGRSPLSWLDFRNGGIVAYGGFLGGFVGSWVYLRVRRRPLLAWADIAAPGLGAGLGLTRIGCYLQGCDYGRPVPDEAPAWVQVIGVRFPNWHIAFPDLDTKASEGLGFLARGIEGAPAYLHHVRDGLVEAGSAFSAPVYPTQPAESLVGWVAFAMALLVLRNRRFAGQAFLVVVAWYGLTRTLLEFFRGDLHRGGVGFLSTSQIVGLATLGIALVALRVLSRRAAYARASSTNTPRSSSSDPSDPSK